MCISSKLQFWALGIKPWLLMSSWDAKFVNEVPMLQGGPKVTFLRFELIACPLII